MFDSVRHCFMHREHERLAILKRKTGTTKPVPNRRSETEQQPRIRSEANGKGLDISGIARVGTTETGDLPTNGSRPAPPPSEVGFRPPGCGPPVGVRSGHARSAPPDGERVELAPFLRDPSASRDFKVSSAQDLDYDTETAGDSTGLLPLERCQPAASDGALQFTPDFYLPSRPNKVGDRFEPASSEDPE